jgi:protein NRD1
MLLSQLTSSTAMSRRIATDTGGRRGPQSSRDERNNIGGGRLREDRRNDRNDNNPNNMPVGVMPNMPFPMNFNMPGMPAFPPGFTMPGFPQLQQNQNQPE